MVGRSPTSSAPARVAAALVLAAVASACGQLVAASPAGTPPRPPPSVFMVSASGDVLPELVGRVRAVPGVEAVARVAFARVDATRGGAPAPIMVAAVQPSEFRPLATAVIDGGATISGALARGRLLLARDDHARLGAGRGRMLFRGPGGRAAALRVASLETDSVLNLADGLVSLRDAARLGIGRPTVILVAVPAGRSQATVVAALTRALQVPHGPARSVAYLVGSAASREFGSFRYRSNADGTISPDPSWVRANIRTRVVPILGTVTCHRLMFAQLVGALREIRRARLTGEIDVIDFHRSGGCYVARRQMWNASLPISMHAWGLAIDLNVRENPYGKRPRQDPGLVAIFERWGFAWGGRWSPPDGMHFQLAALLRS
jgi:hypothetical protein